MEIPDMKQCARCHCIKYFNDFYRSRTSKSGRKSYCKKCCLEIQNAYRKTPKGKLPNLKWRKKNKEKSLEIWRKYYQRSKDEINKLKSEKRKADPLKTKDNDRRWYKKFPNKINARTRTRAALKRGLLIKPDRCQECGFFGKTEAHHPNYEKPLNVLFLCKKCHGLKHRRYQNVA